MKIAITKKGNAVGFTAEGFTVTGQYLPKRKAWYIGIHSEYAQLFTDERARNFATKKEAAAYAATIIDAAKTEELKWWN